MKGENTYAYSTEKYSFMYRLIDCYLRNLWTLLDLYFNGRFKYGFR